MSEKTTRIPHVRIVGGGIAGLILATRLGDVLGRSDKARISLVDCSPTHVWKPMLHTFAAGTWNIYQQQVQYLAHAREHHFQFIPGRLEGLDRSARLIHLAPVESGGELIADGRDLEYDVLILAFGSRANDFNTPGVLEHCHFIDSQNQADEFNNRVRLHAARSYINGSDISIAIVGGGATGVELTAELTRMLELATAYGEVDMRSRLRLTLLESSPRILNAFPEEISTLATTQLRSIGVDVRTGVKVVGADAEGFLLDGNERVPASLKVWAAGIRAANALEGGGLEYSRGNQIVVGPNLHAKGDERIFALGDCSSFTPDGAERPLPATAQVANQQALHLARHLPAWLSEGREIPPFKFQDFGSLVSLSDYNAFGTLGRFGFFKGGFIKGRFAQLSHAILYRRHQLTVHGFRKALLLWAADLINARVHPPIRLG